MTGFGGICGVSGSAVCVLGCNVRCCVDKSSVGSLCVICSCFGVLSVCGIISAVLPSLDSAIGCNNSFSKNFADNSLALSNTLEINNASAVTAVIIILPRRSGWLPNISTDSLIQSMLLIWKIIKIKQLVLYEDTSIQPVRQAGFSGDIHRLDVYSAASSG